TMVTPGQTQAFNPARSLFRGIGFEPDWLAALPDSAVPRFAEMVGRIAARCGYGLDPSRQRPALPVRVGRDWEHMLTSATTGKAG
ncbi:hypothetical protein ACFTIK_26925, partial [Tistrella mobilis]